MRYFTYFRERRAGLDRRYYAYDSYSPDRRLNRQRRSGLDRRDTKIIFEKDEESNNLDCCEIVLKTSRGGI